MKPSTIFALILTATFAGQVFAGPVNINTASAAELDSQLDGVGPTIAQRIVAYRSSNGRFLAAADLVEVKGIGEKILSKNADSILVE